ALGLSAASPRGRPSGPTVAALGGSKGRAGADTGVDGAMTFSISVTGFSAPGAGRRGRTGAGSKGLGSAGAPSSGPWARTALCKANAVKAATAAQDSRFMTPPPCIRRRGYNGVAARCKEERRPTDLPFFRRSRYGTPFRGDRPRLGVATDAT